MFEIYMCENNINKGINHIIEKLKNNISDVEIHIAPCLGHCTDCSETFFAVIDSEIVYGDTEKELYDNILAYYNELITEEY